MSTKLRIDNLKYKNNIEIEFQFLIVKKYKIALVGNTNAGKTTFLNTLCELKQETSNYPGTTVELFKTQTKYKNINYEITDLPGTYSLSPFSEEEKVTRKVLQKEKFDFVVQVIEPNFKKRSLGFTLELMELNLPLFIVINNKDNSWKKTDFFLQNLKKKLGISGININALKQKTKNIFFEKLKNQKINFKKYKKILNKVHYSLKKEINFIQKEFKINNLWTALKILEKDQEIIKKFCQKNTNIKNKVASFQLQKIEQKDKDYNFEIKQNRFNFIEQYLIIYLGLKHKHHQHFQCQRNKCIYSNYFVSDKIDHILLNKWLGIPIFLGLMWLVFQVTFTLGAMPMDFINESIGFLQKKLTSILPKNLWTSVLTDGVIGGVGATLVFLPPIIILFFFLSFLQQSGYLARTAYLLDNIMQKIGLSGKCFVPLLMGFGCSVPAIMATKTLMSKKEKIITSMMIPFMSCGAKLPIYTLFISAFLLPQHRGNALFLIYIFGILMGILSGCFFDRIIKNKKKNLLLELPVYTWPKLKNVYPYALNSAKEFLLKAGKIILPLVIILWFLFTFPVNEQNKNMAIENSYAAKIGKIIEPIFQPLGFDWRISTGLLAGLGAKEVFISTFGTIYSLEEGNKEGLINKLQNDPVFRPLTVISLLIFILIYTPCIAVISILKQEIGFKWSIIGFIYPTILAWILSFLVYQIGLNFF